MDRRRDRDVGSTAHRGGEGRTPQIFLAWHLGLTVPIMGLGAVTRYVSPTTGFTAFCVVILVVLAAVGLELRALRT